MLKIRCFQIVIFIIISISLHSQTLVSFNIRYNNPNDGENSWENRKDELSKLIIKYQPDIFGIQEGLYEQNEFLNNQLSDYKYVGVGRDDGKTKGEYSPIFYNTSKYELLETGTYWLSETPERISVGWDASMERITTFGVFKNKTTHDTIYVFNCHYDHIGELARENSSRLILKLIADKNLINKPLVVMGDLNSLPDSQAIKILNTKLSDSFEKSDYSKTDSIQTFNSFDNQFISNKRIDYIFTRNLDVKSYKIITDKRGNGLFISDHFPVSIVLDN